MQSDHYRWRLLGVVLLTMLSFGSSNTILAVALGPMADELGSSESVLAWTVTAPFLALGVATPVLGKLGDMYGHRRLYALGTTTFALASIGSALAWDAGSVIAFRALAGVGGAAAFPSGQAMILSNFAPDERARALGWFNVVATGAPALGLALSGSLIDWFGWRPVIGFYAAVAAVGAGLASTALRPSRRGPAQSLDVAGSLTLATTILAAMLGLSQAARLGAGHPFVVALFVLTPIALVAFVLVERRATHPILPTRHLRHRNFRFPLLSFFMVNGPYMGGLLLLPLVIEDVFGWELASATPLLLLRPGALAVSSPLGGAIATRAGERAAAVVATACILSSMLVFAAAVATTTFLLLPLGLILSGMALGIGGPAHQTAVANAVGDDDLGLGSGLMNTAASLGTVVGSQILLIVLGDGDPFGSGDFVVPFLLGAGFGAVAFASALRFEPRSTASVPSAG